ncbi:Vacuolar protein-sorting-associated protein 33 [Ophidiomyces ophidiicola]|uniref:Vacuolar protein-sorting-associated protein 33 n=1 Tax=Ophidiomyces ophidiicola TaxID=1387563 RepID=UPI0020C4F21D|nr:Vacuolar protein-sorting-associated protein 33 [Ophidiomyces ophidiicola]KAI1936989.1 Vacuolar protein-sorting-associated protein 33 [Ophidiomyces ophidiicola]KAI1951760.1 Vacuolar protein-sorting-associated protein 33 [Ophidiomyces ophidiicola]KAI2046827.1 Vacuolar protein-sorting-associated protein 33 [Ophidiomyces ophidiicola]KAI2055579.1 Vacuolar protein-sorting-associated protein 33 [Ophidiomyces ophidiicola]KAI2058597.1 Vacuolar protein-sorting-associated protein 33 [Ophidiomyces ophi
MAPHPGLEADYIKEKSQEELLSLLEGVRGKKNLVISKELAGPLGLFVKFSALQEYGVDRVFLLENENVDSSQRNIVFLVHAEKPKHVSTVAAQIRKLQRNGTTEHEYSIFWVPRRTLVSNQILEDEGIIGDVNIAELPLYFFPLENDVLSLELPESFGDLYLHHDPSSIYLSVKALMQLQRRHGIFPRIVGKGDNAKKLADQLLRMRKEADAEESSELLDASGRGLMVSSTIESLIVIDRDVDFATTLMTQLTYEGLVDEFFGIKHNQAEIDSTIIGAGMSQNSSSGSSSAVKQSLNRKIQVDSSDQLFSQLRDANFAIVGGILNKIARRLESDYESRHGAKTTSELREFVNKLPAYQAEHTSLKTHTNLAEEIMRQTRSDIFRRILEVQQNLAAGADPSTQHDLIEELIARNVPINSVLRLMCIESCVGGGFRHRDLENFKKQILQAYGYQHLVTLYALEKMELLQSRSSATAMILPTGSSGGASNLKTNYGYLRKALRLIVDEVDEQNPNDIAYVYSGYAPLSIRLIQCIIQKPHILALTKSLPAPAAAASASGSTPSPGWLGFEDIVKSARGATFNLVQKTEEKASRTKQTLTGNGGVKTVIIFFLGGITFAEIAALRFISKQEESRRRILICTTGIVNGNRVMEAAIETATLEPSNQ